MTPVNVTPESQAENCAVKWDDVFTPIVPEPLQLRESHLPKLDATDRVGKGV